LVGCCKRDLNFAHFFKNFCKPNMIHRLHRMYFFPLALTSLMCNVNVPRVGNSCFVCPGFRAILSPVGQSYQNTFPLALRSFAMKVKIIKREMGQSIPKGCLPIRAFRLIFPFLKTIFPPKIISKEYSVKLNHSKGLLLVQSIQEH